MSRSAKTLVTGASGLLGPYVVDAFRPLGQVIATGRRHGDVTCDLSDAAEAEDLVKQVQPDLVIHAAAMTDVDRCEREPDAAYRTNTRPAELLARLLPHAAKLVLLSTDQVYPDGAGPHLEPNVGPVNSYGRSKLAAEHAVRERQGGLIVRTNFFGPSRTPGRASLSDFVLEALTRRTTIRVFEDVLFSPLHVTTLASALVDLVQRDASGVFNVASSAGDSKAAFAMMIATHSGLDSDVLAVGSSESLAGRAPRPHDLRMAVGRWEALVGRAAPTLEEEVKRL